MSIYSSRDQFHSPGLDTLPQYRSWKVILPLVISFNNSSLSSARKGEYPPSRVYAITLKSRQSVILEAVDMTYPMLQQSTLNPWPFPMSTSGAA